MAKAKQVTVIPATLNLHSRTPTKEVTKRRVAAYARVSTDSEEQLTSYEAQVDYYTKFIQDNPDWEFVEDSHPAIIEPWAWEQVQVELEQRKKQPQSLPTDHSLFREDFLRGLRRDIRLQSVALQQ